MKGLFLDQTIRLKCYKQPIWFFSLSASVSLPLEALALLISLFFLPSTIRKWAASWIADLLAASDPAQINTINSFHLVQLSSAASVF